MGSKKIKLINILKRTRYLGRYEKAREEKRAILKELRNKGKMTAQIKGRLVKNSEKMMKIKRAVASYARDRNYRVPAMRIDHPTFKMKLADRVDSLKVCEGSKGIKRYFNGDKARLINVLKSRDDACSRSLLKYINNMNYKVKKSEKLSDVIISNTILKFLGKKVRRSKQERGEEDWGLLAGLLNGGLSANADVNGNDRGQEEDVEMGDGGNEANDEVNNEGRGIADAENNVGVLGNGNSVEERRNEVELVQQEMLGDQKSEEEKVDEAVRNLSLQMVSDVKIETDPEGGKKIVVIDEEQKRKNLKTQEKAPTPKKPETNLLQFKSNLELNNISENKKSKKGKERKKSKSRDRGSRLIDGGGFENIKMLKMLTDMSNIQEVKDEFKFVPAKKDKGFVTGFNGENLTAEEFDEEFSLSGNSVGWRKMENASESKIRDWARDKDEVYREIAEKIIEENKTKKLINGLQKEEELVLKQRMLTDEANLLKSEIYEHKSQMKKIGAKLNQGGKSSKTKDAKSKELYKEYLEHENKIKEKEAKIKKNEIVMNGVMESVKKNTPGEAVSVNMGDIQMVESVANANANVSNIEGIGQAAMDKVQKVVEKQEKENEQAAVSNAVSVGNDILDSGGVSTTQAVLEKKKENVIIKRLRLRKKKKQIEKKKKEVKEIKSKTKKEEKKKEIKRDEEKVKKMEKNVEKSMKTVKKLETELKKEEKVKKVIKEIPESGKISVEKGMSITDAMNMLKNIPIKKKEIDVDVSGVVEDKNKKEKMSVAIKNAAAEVVESVMKKEIAKESNKVNKKMNASEVAEMVLVKERGKLTDNEQILTEIVQDLKNRNTGRIERYKAEVKNLFDKTEVEEADKERMEEIKNRLAELREKVKLTMTSAEGVGKRSPFGKQLETQAKIIGELVLKKIDKLNVNVVNYLGNLIDVDDTENKKVEVIAKDDTKGEKKELEKDTKKKASNDEKGKKVKGKVVKNDNVPQTDKIKVQKEVNKKKIGDVNLSNIGSTKRESERIKSRNVSREASVENVRYDGMDAYVKYVEHGEDFEHFKKMEGYSLNEDEFFFNPASDKHILIKHPKLDVFGRGVIKREEDGKGNMIAKVYDPISDIHIGYINNANKDFSNIALVSQEGYFTSGIGGGNDERTTQMYHFYDKLEKVYKDSLKEPLKNINKYTQYYYPKDIALNIAINKNVNDYAIKTLKEEIESLNSSSDYAYKETMRIKRAQDEQKYDAERLASIREIRLGQLKRSPREYSNLLDYMYSKKK